MNLDSKFSRARVTRSIIGLNLFIMGICVLSWLMYQRYADYLLEVMSYERPLLVFQLQQTALLFVWFPLLGILIAANIEMIFVKLLQRPKPPILITLQKVATYQMLFGIALLVFGNQLVNPRWANTFTEAGYTRCQTVILEASKHFFNEAWVLEPRDCFDPVLKQILHNDHSRRGFDQGARYLEQKHRFLEQHKAAEGA